MPVWMYKRTQGPDPRQRPAERLTMSAGIRYPTPPRRAPDSDATRMDSSQLRGSHNTPELMQVCSESHIGNPLLDTRRTFTTPGQGLALLNQQASTALLLADSLRTLSMGMDAWKQHEKHETGGHAPTAGTVGLVQYSRLNMRRRTRSVIVTTRAVRHWSFAAEERRRRSKGDLSRRVRHSLPDHRGSGGDWRRRFQSRPASAPAPRLRQNSFAGAPTTPQHGEIRRRRSGASSFSDAPFNVRRRRSTSSGARREGRREQLQRLGVEELLDRGVIEGDEEACSSRLMGDETAVLLQLHARAAARHAELRRAREAAAAAAQEQGWQDQAAARQEGLADYDELASPDPSPRSVSSPRWTPAPQLLREAGLRRTAVHSEEARARSMLRASELEQRPPMPTLLLLPAPPGLAATDGAAPVSRPPPERPSQKCRRKLAALEAAGEEAFLPALPPGRAAVTAAAPSKHHDA